MRFVATKTPEQQSCLTLHGARHLLIRQQSVGDQVSREIRRNGGSQAYRANRADRRARERALRP